MSDRAGDLPAQEPRWPVALAILALLALTKGLPDHVQILPGWAGWALAAAALMPVAGVASGSATRRWLAIEAVVVTAFTAIVVLLLIAALAILIRHIVGGASPMSGIVLFTSSVVIWVCNVITFSLLYWQIDGGGPTGRQADTNPDWLFTHPVVHGAVQQSWLPRFVDYLWLGFSTATAFSTTDVTPVTPRAKLLMMAESAISLVTLVVVASRAIGVLGQ